MFVCAFINSDIKLGLSFAFAGFMAIYTGVIYKGGHVIVFVIVGIILAMPVPPMVLEGLKLGIRGDWISAITLFILGLCLWILSSRLKKGESLE